MPNANETDAATRPLIPAAVADHPAIEVDPRVGTTAAQNVIVPNDPVSSAALPAVDAADSSPAA